MQGRRLGYGCIDEAAERCVNVLLELIGTRVSYVVQEAVVVMKVSKEITESFLAITDCLRYRTSSANIPPHMKV